MNENLGEYKKIMAKSIFAWIKVGITGILFSLMCLIIGASVLFVNSTDQISLSQIFMIKPFAAILTFLSLILFFVYILLANTISLKTLMRGVWNHKLSDFIEAKVYSYIRGLTEKQPDWLKGITGTKFVKIFLEVVSQDGTLNKVQRLVLRCGVKKMKLKDEDFVDIEHQLPQIVIHKIKRSIQSLIHPSYLLFYILLTIQFVLLILALLF